MKQFVAFVAIAGASIGVAGCSPKDAGPGKKAVEAPKPDMGEPGNPKEMHDQSKGKSTVATPEPKADDSKQPARKQEPAVKDSKTEPFEEAPPPEGKTDKADAKKAEAKQGGPVDDTKDDKEEEEQKYARSGEAPAEPPNVSTCYMRFESGSILNRS